MGSLYNLLQTRQNVSSFLNEELSPYTLFVGELNEDAFHGLNIELLDAINENAYYRHGVTEIICEKLIDGEFEDIHYLSESILTVGVGKIIDMIKAIVGFIKGLFDKLNAFTDQFEKNTSRWLNKYRQKALNADKYIKDYTYEGYKWDTAYFTDNPYPKLEMAYTKTADHLNDLVEKYNRFGRSAKGSQEINPNEMEKFANDIKSNIEGMGGPDGLTTENTTKGLEKILGCKISEISSFYLKKARRGTEVTTITGFRSVSVSDMLSHIEASTDRLAAITNDIKEIGDDLSKAYDKIKNLKVEDYKEIPTVKKDENKSKADSDGVYSNRDSYNDLTQSSKLLSDAVSTMMDLWRKYTNVTNSINFVKMEVIKTSTNEFMTVLTKFSNQKIKG